MPSLFFQQRRDPLAESPQTITTHGHEWLRALVDLVVSAVTRGRRHGRKLAGVRRRAPSTLRPCCTPGGGGSTTRLAMVMRGHQSLSQRRVLLCGRSAGSAARPQARPVASVSEQAHAAGSPVLSSMRSRRARETVIIQTHFFACAALSASALLSHRKVFQQRRDRLAESPQTITAL